MSLRKVVSVSTVSYRLCNMQQHISHGRAVTSSQSFWIEAWLLKNELLSKRCFPLLSLPGFPLPSQCLSSYTGIRAAWKFSDGKCGCTSSFHFKKGIKCKTLASPLKWKIHCSSALIARLPLQISLEEVWVGDICLMLFFIFLHKGNRNSFPLGIFDHWTCMELSVFERKLYFLFTELSCW